MSKDNTFQPENQEFSYYRGPITNRYPKKEAVTINQIYTLALSNELRATTAAIRNESDQFKRRKLKERLPYITPAGTFKSRSKKDLIKRSGFIVVDIDHISQMEPSTTIEQVKKKIFELIIPVFLFISPSGDGLKVIYALDVEQGEHEQYFLALQAFFKSEMDITIDGACKDISRACFLCHDPAAGIFENPEILDGDFIEKFSNIDSQVSTETPPSKSQNDKPYQDNGICGQTHAQGPFAVNSPMEIAAFMIRGAKDGEKHDVLLRASRFLGGFVASSEITWEEAEYLLTNEIKKKKNIDSIEDAEKTILDGLSFGAKDPIHRVDVPPEPEETNAPPPHENEPEGDPQQDQDPNPKTDEELNMEALIHSIIVDHNRKIPEPPTVISYDNVSVCTLGNFSLIIGRAKTRKTFLLTAVAAAAISDECNIEGLTGSMPPKTEVHYFDTEQSTYQVHLTARRIATQAISTNFKVYEMRPLTTEERMKIIEYIITRLKVPAFIIIDGLRDLLSMGINDEAEATRVISKLLKWTHDKKIHIMLVLHQNKNDANARGHIGTEAVNKAETVFLLTKNRYNEEITIVSPGYCRGMDFPPFSFRINDVGLPEVAFQTQETGQVKKFTALQAIFTEVMHQRGPIRHTDLEQELMRLYEISSATAKRRIGAAVKSGIIIKTDAELYTLNEEMEDDGVST